MGIFENVYCLPQNTPFVIDESEKGKDGKTAFLWPDHDLRNKKEACLYNNHIHVLGNIFDDLKAPGKPLEEFEMHPAFGGRKVEISGKKTGGIWMGIMNTYDTLDKKGARLSLAEAEEIHRNLGRVIATKKAELAKAAIESAGGEGE